MTGCPKPSQKWLARELPALGAPSMIHYIHHIWHVICLMSTRLDSGTVEQFNKGLALVDSQISSILYSAVWQQVWRKENQTLRFLGLWDLVIAWSLESANSRITSQDYGFYEIAPCRFSHFHRPRFATKDLKPERSLWAEQWAVWLRVVVPLDQRYAKTSSLASVSHILRAHATALGQLLLGTCQTPSHVTIMMSNNGSTSGIAVISKKQKHENSLTCDSWAAIATQSCGRSAPKTNIISMWSNALNVRSHPPSHPKFI